MGRLEPEASKYEADKSTLERLHETLASVKDERDRLVSAITSGQMVVQVANWPKTPAGGGAPSGVAPAESP